MRSMIEYAVRHRVTVLMAATAAVLFGALLASLNYAWQPRIRQNEIDKFNRLAGGLLTDAASFEPAVEDLPDLGQFNQSAIGRQTHRQRMTAVLEKHPNLAVGMPRHRLHANPGRMGFLLRQIQQQAPAACHPRTASCLPARRPGAR